MCVFCGGRVQKPNPSHCFLKGFHPVYNPSRWAVYTPEKEQDAGNKSFDIPESTSVGICPPSRNHSEETVSLFFLFWQFVQTFQSPAWVSYPPLNLPKVTGLNIYSIKPVTVTDGRWRWRCSSSGSGRPPLPVLHLSSPDACWKKMKDQLILQHIYFSHSV